MLSANLKTIASAASVTKVASRTLASHATSHKASSAKPGEVKVSSLPSGAILASVGSDSPLARVAIVVRAGSRYEPRDQLGLTHILRASAGLATEKFTGFGITRNIEYYGGRLAVNGTRDTLSYLLEVHNDDDILTRNFAMLADTVSRPAFKPWELSDNLEKINVDLSIVADTPYIQLAEALHSVAYKGGLRKSLYTPKYMVGKHESERLLKYVQERFVAPVIVGVGIEHQQLVDLVGANINFGSHQPPKCISKYIGGEVHIDAAGPLTYVAIAGEGAGLQNTKDAVALSLFQTILGAGSQIKNAYGLSTVTRLGKALASSAGPDTAVSAFNINYQEQGLFGINVIAPSSSDVTALVKTAIKELRTAAGSITDAELDAAKANLKTAALLAVDTGDNLALELGNQLALTGAQIDVASLIDSITAADIKSIAGKVVKSKPTLATVGPNAPFLDDLA